MAEIENLTQEITETIAGAAPVVTQESEAQRRLEEVRRNEMSKLMEQLENERATKGNFSVTVAYKGDEETRDIVFIQPVKTNHYSEYRHGTVVDPEKGTVSRPLEATTFTFACKDGFRTLVLETEDVPRNYGEIAVNHVV